MRQKNAQKTTSAGSEGSVHTVSTDGKGTDEAESRNPSCFWCGDPRHMIKDYKAHLVCLNYSVNHLSDRCAMLNKPHPVLKLAGCGANDWK